MSIATKGAACPLLVLGGYSLKRSLPYPIPYVYHVIQSRTQCTGPPEWVSAFFSLFYAKSTEWIFIEHHNNIAYTSE